MKMKLLWSNKIKKVAMPLKSSGHEMPNRIQKMGFPECIALERVTGHLFISVLAYHLVHSIRYRLKKADIDSNWSSLRQQLSGQNRITVSMHCKNGDMVHVRKSTRPEPRQEEIYSALGICFHPGVTSKKIINKSSAITDI